MNPPDGTEQRDDFEIGAEDASGIPVIFIDPNELDPNDPAASKAILRERIDSQLPGGSVAFSLSKLVEESLEFGPFVKRFELNGRAYCLMNKPSVSLDKKDEIAFMRSGADEENLKPAPGDDGIWRQGSGYHEGHHCNQIFNVAAAMDPRTEGPLVLSLEAEADRAALDYLSKLGAGDVVQAWKDYRALGLTGAHPSHATSALVDDHGAIEPDADRYRMAESAEDVMVSDVGRALDLSYEESENMMKDEPHRFAAEVEALVNAGMYDRILMRKEYLQNYVDAVRRQIMPEPAAGAPGIEQGATGDQMRIGAVSAPAYFAGRAAGAIPQEPPARPAEPSSRSSQSPEIPSP